MKISINGIEKTFDGVVKLSDIVIKFCEQPRCIVTAVNGDIVLAPDWKNLTLKEGDAIDLVAPVGGG